MHVQTCFYTNIYGYQIIHNELFNNHTYSVLTSCYRTLQLWLVNTISTNRLLVHENYTSSVTSIKQIHLIAWLWNRVRIQYVYTIQKMFFLGTEYILTQLQCYLMYSHPNTTVTPFKQLLYVWLYSYPNTISYLCIFVQNVFGPEHNR